VIRDRVEKALRSQIEAEIRAEEARRVAEAAQETTSLFDRPAERLEEIRREEEAEARLKGGGDPSAS
jgi:hypothetical protein